MNSDLAELWGMHAGDGSLYRTKSGSTVWELRGGLDEKEFYDNHVKELILRATKISVKPKKRSGGKNGCYGIQSCNRQISKTIQNAGFPAGNKTFTVRIPEKVMNGDKTIKATFLKGLFATDGSIFISKANYSKTPNYFRIELCSASELLIEDVKKILKNLNINSTTWKWKPKRGKTCHSLRISCDVDKKKFLRKIGSSNPKHTDKIPLKYASKTTILKRD